MTNGIYESEKTHFQWKKQGLNFMTFAMLLLVTIFRGSKKVPSDFVEPCSFWDWTSVALYCVVMVVLCGYAVKTVQWEQNMKMQYGKGVEEGEIDLKGGNLYFLLGFSLLGGWVSGALGLGGGAIFNPLLLSMGVPPKVASASGMYMIIFATGSSTFTYILNGMLTVDYSLWVAGCCMIGTVLGMITLELLMKKFNRQSPLLFLLVGIFLLSTVAVPIFGYIKLSE